MNEHLEALMSKYSQTKRLQRCINKHMDIEMKT